MNEPRVRPVVRKTNGKPPRGDWRDRFSKMPRFGINDKPTQFWLGVLVLALIALFFITLPDVRQISKAAPGNSIQIFDKQNKLVVTIDGDEEREFTPLSNIPKITQRAIIAAEDHNFYNHKGISFKGIMRAFLVNAEAGRVKEGGSTLTQQLAKNLFFDSADRSIIRKLRELVLAVEIEHSFTKDQILEMYMNQVYFGRSAYGLERASMRYFGHSAKTLNLPESAFLMGLVKAPSYYGDPDNVKAGLERQKQVLNEMVEMKFITQAQADKAAATKLAFSRSNKRLTKFPYYMSAVQQFLQTHLDKMRLEEGGLRVYTNLDQTAQQQAERVVSQRVRAGGGGMNQCALVSVLVEDGSVVALVGGAGDYWAHQWNSAVSPHTMGSSFKPFVYLTGFLQGKITPDTVVNDEPIIVHQGGGMPDWVPKNFDGDYYGPLTIREAIAYSRNIIAVRVAQAVGIGNVITTAHSAGIKSKLIPTPALALGASAASPLEMASAYSTIARAGTYIEPQLVRRVEARNGWSEEYRSNPQKVFPDSPVRALISCMESVVKEGTATGARLSDRPVAGKTGTSDEARDLWFCGFTPHMVTTVWGGNDQHRSLGGATGGVMLTGIWRAYNQAYYRTHKVPAGSFYTEGVERKDNGNIFDSLLRHPDDVLKEAEEQLKGEEKKQPEPGVEEQGGQQQPNGEAVEGQQPGQEGQAPDGAEQQRPFMLPGMPVPGQVRRVPFGRPSMDPFAPGRYDMENQPQEVAPPDEGSAPMQYGPPQNQRYGPPMQQQPQQVQPQPQREPQPAPDRQIQRAPQSEPQPAPERAQPAPSGEQDYGPMLRDGSGQQGDE